MEINKIILVGYCTGVASVIAMTGVALHKIVNRHKEDTCLNASLKVSTIRDDTQDILINDCNERIKELNKRVDSLEKSNKK